MKINLIFFLSRFTYGGAGLSIFKLCKALPKNKYNINIICLNECSFDKKFKKLKIKVFKLRYKKTFFAMPKIFFIIKKILKNKYKKNILISNIHYTNVLSIIFLRLISNLKITCTDLRLLLDFQLNKKFAIKTAIDAVSKIKMQYHHDVLHLRYSYHTISMCAEVHNFTSNQKQKIMKKGVVI